jgi:hypothetical protein
MFTLENKESFPSSERRGGGNKRNERMGIISIVTEPGEGECDMERIETKQMFHFDIEQGSLK